MKLDLRRRMNGRPRKYRPGTAPTPPSWTHPAALIERQPIEPPDTSAGSPSPTRPWRSGRDRAPSASRPRRRQRTRRTSAAPRRSRVRRRTRPSRSRSRVLLEVGVGEQVGEPAGELRPPAVDAHQPADHVDAAGTQRVEVERAVLRAADELQRRQPAGPVDVVDLVVALVELADRIHPPVDVPAAVASREADVLADGDHHVATAAPELVGDLDARGRRTDHQHAAVVELRRVAVAQRRQLADGRRQLGGQRRHPRLAGRSRRGDDRGARPGALVGHHVEADPARPDLR